MNNEELKTKRGIFLNINKSNYFLDVGEYRFFFSSKVYLKKFEEQLENYKEYKNYRFSKYFLNKVDLKEFFMFELYTKIEKRGFKVEMNGKKLKTIPKFILKKV